MNCYIFLVGLVLCSCFLFLQVAAMEAEIRGARVTRQSNNGKLLNVDLCIDLRVSLSALLELLKLSS
ncbi:hypothetical protein HNY73_013914 [Argiope bruennichi]|uniref:Uncharacterized protein n=1 Tax=Argiope bruennichi TaxID=94029 RepID=A0A8T0EM58_ARGBR|nr:hypothetical protein HNY73_013914 [Argiope bruennichi]